ncbi:MAG: diguanylate cyclase [Azoarcus sp.]|jgi:diguanylate cyclase (GGDEF)-like protein/PAS domain S-box-containing protein|nr:diguanylate cyclase [Azoarcus sp.]
MNTDDSRSQMEGEADAPLFRLVEKNVTGILNSIPIACIIRNDNNCIEYCNQAAPALFGVESGQELIERQTELIPGFQPDNESSIARIVREVLDSGKPQENEWMFQTASGEALPVLVFTTRIPWMDGGWRIASFYIDLRQHKTLEKQLRITYERIRIMLEATPLCATIWDSQANLLDCNEGAVRMLNAPDKAYVLEHFFGALCPETQPNGESSATAAPRYMREALENGQAHFLWTHQTAQGEPVPAQATMRRIRGEDGNDYVAAYCFDLREIKAKEAETREANARALVMLNAIQTACILFDHEGTPLDCNTRTLALFGYPDKETFLRDFHRLYPNEQADGAYDEQKCRARIRAASEAGQDSFQRQRQYFNKKGEIFPAEVTLCRVPWRGSWRVLSTIHDLRDIHMAREKSEALKVENRAIQAAAEAKSTFLATMSHEIRTPMNAILGLADLMRTDNLDEAQVHALRDIRSMSNVLLQIVNDILDLSTMDAGKVTLTPVNYSIRNVFDNVCSLIRVTLRGKTLQFRHDVASNVPDILHGDEVRLRQVMFNILSNAVKYTNEGWIEFRAERVLRNGRDYLAIIVRDTGIGIRQKDIPRIFESFARFDTKENRHIAGTGLGLPIVHRLVKLMDGEIAVQSEYGAGSTFTVWLPLTEGNAASANHAQETAPSFTVRPDTKVLIVDDSAINLTVAAGYLARRGIKAETAESGIAAIRKVAAAPFDLVFMDHMMPEMDGIEATLLIRAMDGERFRALPIVALSANVITGMRDTFLAAGMNDFVSKPIDSDNLDKVLVRWLPRDKLVYCDGETPDAGLASRPVPDASGSTETRIPEAAASPERHCARGEAIQTAHEPAIDRAAGLATFMDDEALYTRILTDFHAKHHAAAAGIADMLAADRRQDAHRLVHTLKSEAAAIGAAHLSAAAADAETLLAVDTDATRTANVLAALAAALQPVLTELERLTQHAEANREAAPDTQMDKDQAFALLDKLEPLLATGSADCLDMSDDIHRLLSPLGPVYEIFAAQMRDLDFPSALETLSMLQQKMLLAGDAPEGASGATEDETRNTILLVDDDTLNLLALKKILSPDYDVFIAKSGAQALKMLTSNKPDLILLDVMMPGMSGFDVLTCLKSDEATRNIPVIFITGLTGEEDEEKGFSLGVSDYIQKPFRPTVVKVRVDTQMRIVRQLRASETASHTDSLTGIANRRQFDDRLALEWRRAIREKSPVAFLMMDIDKFKTYNDTYGHPQGDALLKAVARIFSETARRPGDLAARLGGEEFGMLLPQSSLDAALTVAERILAQVSATEIPTTDGQPTHTTISIGAAAIIPTLADDPKTFLAHADANLYTAKKSGRNRVCTGGGWEN